MVTCQTAIVIHSLVTIPTARRFGMVVARNPAATGSTLTYEVGDQRVEHVAMSAQLYYVVYSGNPLGVWEMGIYGHNALQLYTPTKEEVIPWALWIMKT